MGLDSVELLMRFEDYFKINIPDKEAENIITVQEMVDCTAIHLNISNIDSTLRNDLFKKLESCLINNNVINKNLSQKDKVFTIINPDDITLWNLLESELELKIPFPFRKKEGLISKILLSKYWAPNYDWKTITIDEFIIAIAANNYQKLINPNNIKCKDEILIAVIAITVDKLGVDVYEVQPNKSFVNDFGIS